MDGCVLIPGVVGMEAIELVEAIESILELDAAPSRRFCECLKYKFSTSFKLWRCCIEHSKRYSC